MLATKKAEAHVVPQPSALPALVRISGHIRQILLQEKEHFYTVCLNDGTTTRVARFGDSYTGKKSRTIGRLPDVFVDRKSVLRKRTDLPTVEP